MIRSTWSRALVSCTLFAGLLGSCASRALPSRSPQSSPLATDAPQVAPARLVVLTEDPPLPGEPSPGWQLDAPDAETEDAHAH